jgi:hypothetical protein
MTSGELLKLARRSSAAAWFIPADMCYVKCTLALEKTWHDQLGHYWIMHLGSYFLALNSTKKSNFFFQQLLSVMINSAELPAVAKTHYDQPQKGKKKHKK